MICVICRNGATAAGKTTVTLERGALTLVVRGVPAQVCPVCGEAYIDEAASAELLQTAEQAAKEGVRVEIREYSVA
ncbi:MAG: hypothetical protein FD180_885 [Planctomycetota bacterium]|nr:MAG: hypothetical protein FD180_885 [Planctomycetota bacterium]